MKKILILVLEALLLVSIMLTSCQFSFFSESNADTTDPMETEGANESAAEAESASTEEIEDDTPLPNGAPRSLKILAIGNSFSTDAMQYLYEIAKDAGVQRIVLGNLYYGGCSLQQHLTYGTKNSPSYTYYKNDSGKWETHEDYRMGSALEDEDWDYISFQQTSKTCGLRDSYGETLTQLLELVRSKNSTAKFVWHMTWAYQQDSTHSSFPKYGNSQQKMYDMIIDCTKNCILPEEQFELIIPNMTSIQNARTSFLGDTLTRDGYHLNLYIGRYIAGLTYFSAITGVSAEHINCNPAPDHITEEMLAVAKESVQNAIAKPYEITQSQLTD